MLRRNSKYFKWGLTAFVVFMAAVVFWLVFSNLGGVYDLILEFFGIISSLLYGCVFAYLMNPILQFSERIYGRLVRKRRWKETVKYSVVRTSSVVTTVIVFLAAVYALIALIGPSIYNSAAELLTQERLQNYYNTVMEWAHDIFAGSAVEKWVEENVAELMSFLTDFLKNMNIGQFLLGAAGVVYSGVATVFNIVIGVVCGVYILVYKGELCAQAKKLTIAICREERTNRIFERARRTNRIFSGFVIGKLIDAIFVGIVTYLALLIMGMPFAPLIAMLVGVTNIIPFFGPFIGAVPSALLLLIENPINAVYFGIFIVILQMVDGYIVENRILGEKLGLSDFWVLVAILISGGIFGFMGMIVGVPIFAVIYTIITDVVNKRLRKKHLPTATEVYENVVSVEELPSVSQLAGVTGTERDTARSGEEENDDEEE
ncbi:MAG: AI-2E family transporter [Oscillospiraceae bacterium]|nr:AI-2E family transporter [Oscillospiraceae bacterium]